jgi:hypothetical protein
MRGVGEAMKTPCPFPPQAVSRLTSIRLEWVPQGHRPVEGQGVEGAAPLRPALPLLGLATEGRFRHQADNVKQEYHVYETEIRKE